MFSDYHIDYIQDTQALGGLSDFGGLDGTWKKIVQRGRKLVKGSGILRPKDLAKKLVEPDSWRKAAIVLAAGPVAVPFIIHKRRKTREYRKRTKSRIKNMRIAGASEAAIAAYNKDRRKKATGRRKKYQRVVRVGAATAAAGAAVVLTGGAASPLIAGPLGLLKSGVGALGGAGSSLIAGGAGVAQRLLQGGGTLDTPANVSNQIMAEQIAQQEARDYQQHQEAQKKKGMITAAALGTGALVVGTLLI